MFDQLVISSAQGRTHKPWTIALSVVLQVLLIGIAILIPLIYVDKLPAAMLNTFLVAPAPPPPPPPPAAPVVKVRAPKLVPLNKMVAPTVIPKKIEIVKEEAPAVGGVEGGIGGVPGGVPGGVLGGIIGAPPPPPPKPVTPQRIRVGGNVQQAKMISEPQPVYPAIAKAAHVQGTVLLHAIIAKDGTIQQLQYQSGPAMLMSACMAAVRQWRYQPTLLNGEPVEVETTVSCVFTLGD